MATSGIMLLERLHNRGPIAIVKLVTLGCALQAYSTLGSQWLMKGYAQNPVLTHPALLRVASAAKRSPAQVVLQWALQQGQVSTAHQEALPAV